MAKVTKKQKALAGQVDRNKLYDVTAAAKVLKECAKAKFDESVEVAINLGVDPRHADQQVRGTVSLPHGTGKTVRLAVFAKNEAADEAKKAGADVVGADDLVEKVLKGFLEFDRVVATPDCMPLVGKLGKVLGPKGLMPNPKLGTVTPKPGAIVKDIKSGMLEFRVDKFGIVHSLVGKASFSEKQIAENIGAFISAIRAAKPTGAKGVYMKRATASTTQGPGVRLDMSSVA